MSDGKQNLGDPDRNEGFHGLRKNSENTARQERKGRE